MDNIILDNGAQARRNFPAGLYQPEGSYRFGLDALLLAAFASKLTNAKNNPGTTLRICETGCGCGAALVAFALLKPMHDFLGLDNGAKLIECAEANAKLLELKNCFFMTCELAQVSRDKRLDHWRRQCACVIANPPWRPHRETIRAAAPLRRTALWEEPETLALFLRAARELLIYHGLYCIILPPAKLPDFCIVTVKYGFGIKRILPVSNRKNESAMRLLLACRKESAQQAELLPPLVLREGTGTACRWRPEALEFCPWLAKNY